MGAVAGAARAARAAVSSGAAQVFISYAREDVEHARRLADDLRACGFRAWLDVERLAPGDRWEPAIQKALGESSYCIVWLSPHAVDPQRYVVREIAHAIGYARQLLQSERFLLPARLAPVSVTDEALRQLQFTDLFPSWPEGIAQLCAAMSTTAPSVIRRAPWRALVAGAGLPVIGMYGWLAVDLATDDIDAPLLLILFMTGLPPVLLTALAVMFALQVIRHVRTPAAAFLIGLLAGIGVLLLVMSAG